MEHHIPEVLPVAPCDTESPDTESVVGVYVPATAWEQQGRQAARGPAIELALFSKNVNFF